ncbi:transposase [Streptomyces bungoensis]|uniref:transposase n=1 Tax=Streptomyces bungoensis TaxID=285568 RepID=UPI003F4D1268
MAGMGEARARRIAVSRTSPRVVPLRQQRLRDWNEAGVWQRLHEVLLAELYAASRLDWSRWVVDSSHVRALKGGARRARRRSTVDGPALITDGYGSLLAVLLTGGNRNDVTQLLPLIDAVPPVRGRVGRPRRKPDSLFADRGYDHGVYRDQVRARGIVPAMNTAWYWPGHLPLGGREDVCLVARLPAPAHPLGTQGRHAQSSPQTRLLPHHPPTAQGIALNLEAGLPGAPSMSAARAMIRPYE